MTDAADEAIPGVRPTLTRAMKRVWDLRPDLQALFDLNTAPGQRGFAWWLISHGADESPACASIALAACRDLIDEPAAEALPGVEPALTAFMVHVRSMRPDLQRAFDLATPEGQQEFVWWYLVHGAIEHGLARFLNDAQRRVLNAPDPRMTGADTVIPVTRLMMEVWLRRGEVRTAFPPGHPAAPAAYVEWFLARGLDEWRMADVVDSALARLLLSPDPRTPALPRVLAAIRAADPDVRERFPDPGDPAFHRWAADDGRERYAVLRRIAAVAPEGMVPVRRAAPPQRPFGVNLVGYARGQFGIGEDVRMAATALRAAGVPVSIFNVEPGKEVCQGDTSADALISDRRPYAVDMICTTGIETARLAAIQGSSLFDGRRVIGCWPWELPAWPRDWSHAYDLVDEVWASSRFTYGAYAADSPRPVRHLPMAVAVDATAGLGRRALGLPEDRLLFVFSFDVLSGVARKNPQAAIRAFRAAFPRGDEPVGLVVKVMRASDDNPVWRAVVGEAGGDRRIRFLTGTLSRGAVLDLYRACDVFVSLHRSEGFGRGIAEAMMLGRPVIVTGYSGNMDFTVPGTAALVDHRLRRVGPDDYPYGEGQLWAEPDAGHAAWWMRRLTDDAGLRERLGRQGQALTVATFSPAVVGAGYAAQLARPSG
ncbi:glycosyltransferase family 4 protein [Azospirillum halopraeferens]|uniref:glycosyltransferase family 4 protein n=1 Tax=Azospirillum halopraeferens TaxID=34010 RepID=UPI00146FBC89|nr:glycosyltransferase family 4 protein [Azospirillum halopraeferens]